jgi:hypothetical protein
MKVKVAEKFQLCELNSFHFLVHHSCKEAKDLGRKGPKITGFYVISDGMMAHHYHNFTPYGH